jgi:hypothetical protein
VELLVHVLEPLRGTIAPPAVIRIQPVSHDVVTRLRKLPPPTGHASLAAVQECLGASAAEIAGAMGASPAVLYELRRGLRDDCAATEQPRVNDRKGYTLTSG